MNNIKNTDVLIVGSGLSGLTAALMLPNDIKITLITKGKINQCSTSWAQGGIAAVLAETDSFKKHLNDTIHNGQGLVNKDVAMTIIKEAPFCIQWLINNDIQFTKTKNKINLTLEGGHSERRIAYIKDKTGLVIHNKLSDILKSKKNIKIIEECQIIDLIVKKNTATKRKECLGAYLYQKKVNKILTIHSKYLIMGTGGASKIYQFTSNPKTSTGDGVAVAWRAGCTISNVEFIQFHPTCLYHPSIKSFLISESLRGEGGKLLTPDGNTFMEKYDNRKELASRDIVARAIDNEMKTHGYSNVFLDISHESSSFIKKRFPLIYDKCLSVGIDITKERIPVVPASHYTCGGVKTDVAGKTEIDNFFVVGESAHTGFHGANRLASNSLLECLVMSKKCTELLIKDITTNEKIQEPNKLPTWDDSFVSESNENIIISHNWDELRKIMWNYVGIVRSDKRLTRAQERLKIIEREVNEYYYKYKISSDLLELRNIIQVSNLIIKSALKRKESRGLHYSLDYPISKKSFQCDTHITGKKDNSFLKLVNLKV